MFLTPRSFITTSTITTLAFFASDALALGNSRVATDTRIFCISEPLNDYGTTETINYNGKTGTIVKSTDYYDGVVSKTLIKDASEETVNGIIKVAGQRKAYTLFLNYDRRVVDKNKFNTVVKEYTGGQVIEGKLVGGKLLRSTKYDCKLGG
jgi:hypothetical protein